MYKAKPNQPCLCGSGIKWKKCCQKIGIKDTVLLIGNGINYSLKKYLKNDVYDTSNFFSWDIKTPLKENEAFLDNLPELKKELNLLHFEKLSDFDKINKILEKQNKIIEINRERENYSRRIGNFRFDEKSFEEGYNASKCILECRHYISIAFSQYQFYINDETFIDWEWSRWIKKHNHLINHCINLNYDLILEKTLGDIAVPYRRIGAKNERTGISIHKPHGSIDFDCTNNSISAPVGYPLSNVISRADTPLKIIETENLLMPRTSRNSFTNRKIG